jgi:hypothetical protein
MTAFGHRITLGWIHRHLPPRAAVGVEIAVLDIAQDFLLAGLHSEGLFDNLLVFKGGTAIRKMWAGTARVGAVGLWSGTTGWRPSSQG